MTLALAMTPKAKATKVKINRWQIKFAFVIYASIKLDKSRVGAISVICLQKWL